MALVGRLAAGRTPTHALFYQYKSPVYSIARSLSSQASTTLFPLSSVERRSIIRQRAANRVDVKKVLVIASGSDGFRDDGKFFEFSGASALKAFKEAGIKTVLLDPQLENCHRTSYELADTVYMPKASLGLAEFLIEKEKPDGFLVSIRIDQEWKNTLLAFILEQEGIFEKYGVKLLASPVTRLWTPRQRARFVQMLEEIKEIPGDPVNTANKTARETTHDTSSKPEDFED